MRAPRVRSGGERVLPDGCVGSSCTTEVVDFSSGRDDFRDFSLSSNGRLSARVIAETQAEVSLRIEREGTVRFTRTWTSVTLGVSRSECGCATREVDAR